MDTTPIETPTATRHVTVSALAPVALTLVAVMLIWRGSVGPVPGELGWIVAGGFAGTVAMAWSAVAILAAAFGVERRPGDAAVVLVNATNLIAWITLFDGAF